MPICCCITSLVSFHDKHKCPYLEKCVFTLSIEVKPLVIKRNIVALPIDTTNSITDIVGACKLPSTAIAGDTNTTYKLFESCKPAKKN